MPKMKAAIFVEPGRIVLDEKPVPEVGPLDALLRITTTTICGTDVHILKGEYPVAKGLTVGHEPVGVIEKLGSAVKGYREGQRVIAGAITPSGLQQRLACAAAARRTAPARAHGWKAIGGWKFGNTIDGCQAEYVLVPDAMANLAPVPGRAHRRAGADVPRHHVDRILGCRERRRADRRHGGGVRAGADRPVRHGRRQAHGRHDHHRRRHRARAAGDRAQARRGPCGRLPRGRSGGGDHAAHRRSRRRCGDRGARHAGDLRGLPARAAPRRHALEPRRLLVRPHHPAGRFRGRASATTGSSPRSAPAARSGCGG